MIRGAFQLSRNLKMSMLRLSLNELSALLKSALQGCFRHSQDWAAITETIIWLESRGFGGLNLLMEAMDDNHHLTPFTANIIETDDPSVCAIDAGGSSLLLGLHMCSDIAADMATRHGQATLIINNATQTSAIIAATVPCARFGHAVRSTWKDGFAQISLNDVSPSVHEGQFETVEIKLCKVFESEATPVLTSAEVQARYELSLAQGLEVGVDIYKTLNGIADRILVEATKASRRGAGE